MPVDKRIYLRINTGREVHVLLVVPARPIIARRLSGLVISVALHAAALAVLVTVSSVPRATSQRKLSKPVVTFVAAPEEPGAQPGDRELADAPAAADDTGSKYAGNLHVAGFDFDIARIRSRKDALFAFLTADLLFLDRVEAATSSLRGRLVNPFTAGGRKTSKPPLSITDVKLQAIVDRSWSRRDRWRSFSEIAALVQAHDPDDGRLPDLLRAYLDQNILQPYFDTDTRDPRFWTMLGLVADHIEFIDFVRSYARVHPSSKTTTDLLFLLDELAQGSRDALLMLIDTDPRSDLHETRSVNRDAYDLAVALRREYGGWLERRKLHTADEISAQYDQLRLRLLSTIIDSTPGGYRTADARYLAGEILFKQKKVPEALSCWRAIMPNARDSYAEAYSQVLQELNSPRGTSVKEIDRILRGEYGRWLMFSYDRLRQFGYAFDTF